MNRVFFRTFSLLLAICFVLGTISTGFASEEGEIPAPPEKVPNTVYTQDELVAWLAENQSGTVSLGCSITITSRIFLYDPITIDTGVYGLVFDKEFLVNSEGVAQITGEGVDMPVVEIIDTKLVRGGDWNNLLQGLSVTATGRGGTGGTAMRISAPNAGTLDGLNIQMYEPGKIRSYGAGAIGLELAVPFDVYGFDVTVRGENSVAVYAREGGGVYFCKLSAVDGVSVRSEGDAFAVHGAACFPAAEQEGVTVTHAELSDYPVYIPVEQNSEWRDLEYYITRYCYTATLKETGANSDLSNLFVDYDMDVLAGIDMSKTGITMIPGTLSTMYYSDWFASLLSDSDWPVYLMIDVRDPEMPCIFNVKFYESGSVPVTQLNMWHLPQESLTRCILWRSDDGGEVWYDCTDDPGVYWYEGSSSVEIELSCIGEGTIFQVEIPNVGESNLVVFTFADGVAGSGAGGDRTGTDRIIGAKLGGAKPAPEPDSEPDSKMPGRSGKTSGYHADVNPNTEIQSIASLASDDPPVPALATLADSVPVGAATSEENNPVVRDEIPPPVKEEAALGITIANEGIPSVNLPEAQPELPDPGTGIGIILAISAAAVILAAGGYIALTRRKTRIKP